MHRRVLLSGIGTAVAGALAGYGVLTDPGVVPEPLRGYEYRDGSDVAYEPTLTPAPGVSFDEYDVTLLATVGDRSDVFVGGARGAHDLALVNDADANDDPDANADADAGRELSITLSAGGRQVCSLTPTVDPGGVAVVGLLEPATYAVEVGVPGRTAAFEVPADRFDCNASATYFVVDGDGSVSSVSSGTSMGCGPLADL